MTWAIYKRDMSHKDQRTLAMRTFSLILLFRSKRREAFRSWAGRTLVEFCIGISKFDCDISDLFFLMLDSIYTRYRFY